MRYAVMGATVQQVKNVGGLDIKEARATGIIFATLTKEQADRLRSMGCHVDQVGKVGALVMPPIVAPPIPVAAAPTYSPEQLVWATGLEELRAITEPPLYGSGFNLAIIDSGIRETHEKINGRVVYRKNFTSDPIWDAFNHGTNVCSVALAVAPLCNILNLKVLDDKGSGTEENVVLAVDHCIDLYDTQPDIAPSVINLSLGGPDDGNPNNPMRVACRAAIERGIWVVAAAGNMGSAPWSIMSPACERYVLGIGSAKYMPDEGTYIVSDFSSRGPTKEGLVKPDAVIFGEDIVMASSASDTATIAKSGTSFAAPFCSGMAIIYHDGAYKAAVTREWLVELPPAEIYYISVEELVDTYLPLLCVKPQGVLAGKDYDYGYGLPYGPFVAQAVGLIPAVDISAMLIPVVTIAMLGMIIVPMAKALR